MSGKHQLLIVTSIDITYILAKVLITLISLNYQTTELNVVLYYDADTELSQLEKYFAFDSK